MQSGLWNRLVAGMLALVLSIGALPAFAAAQDDDSDDVPDGAINAANRIFSSGSDDFSVVDSYSFMVIEFEDEDLAEAASEQYVEELLGDSFGDEEAGFEFEEQDELDVADGGRVFTQHVSQDEGESALDIVVVQDGVYVHLWFRFAFAFGFDGTPVPELENVGPEMLIELTETWFEGDPEVEDSLLDLLPGEDDVPEGFILDSEEEGMGAFGDVSDDENFGDGTPEISDEDGTPDVNDEDLDDEEDGARVA